jgi:hypothetical protein
MKILFLSLLLLFNTIWAAKVMPIRTTKDVYPLAFDVIYRVNICNAYSTVIEPPKDYVLLDMILGDSKLFKAEKSENRAILKRLAPDSAKTNLVLILEGPDKLSRSVTFELTGFDAPQISNVQFYVAESGKVDPALEAARTRYKNQLEMTLWEQEKRLNTAVREKTLEKLETFDLKGGAPTSEKLGVKVTVEAVVNSGGKGYVYVFTNASDPEYQVVHLTGIQGKELAKTVTLFRTVRYERGGVRYIYETTPFVKSAEERKYTFFFRVYRERTEIAAKVE